MFSAIFMTHFTTFATKLIQAVFTVQLDSFPA